MRDFRDAKSMAQTLRAALAARGVKITIGESLELIAKTLGAADWNTLAAAIKAAGPPPAEPPSTTPTPSTPSTPPPPWDADARRLDGLAMALGWNDWAALTAALRTVGSDQPGRLSLPTPPDNNLALDRLATTLGWVNWDALTAALRSVLPAQPGRRAPGDRGAPLAAPSSTTRKGTTFSPAMEVSLHRSVALAAERKHGYDTLEHLLLALIDDADAAAVLEACAADLGALRATLTRYVDEELKSLTQMGEVKQPPPTAGFHRVVQRAVIHVQSSGRGVVTGANLLVAIFSERESHACYFLEQQKVTRRDAVNFIAHGVRKGGAAA
jgi:hypothetical protein